MTNSKIKPTTLSGIQPSGELHIGNYLGALKNFVELQKRYNGFFMIADLHSLTEEFNPQTKKQQIFNLAASFLSAGLDPQKSTIFLQSLVPAHTELGWILNCITPIGGLERMTQYKDKAARQAKNINAGLFTYPVLQAADILLYKPPVVPVGEDQVQHMELTRIIARKFNYKFGKTFPEPKAEITRVPRLMSLTNPIRKMSKSEPTGCVFLTDEPDIIRKKISRAVTDTKPDGTMSAGVANLFLLLFEFSDEKTAKKFQSDHDNGTISYKDLKNTLAEDIANGLKQYRTKYKELIKNPDKLLEMLQNGSAKANQVASETLKEVKEKVGLIQ